MPSARSRSSDTTRRPTITDVAAAAGVSPSTVSLVLNEKGSIGEATRARVADVARRLGYEANPLARGLRGQPTRVLALNLRSLDVGGLYQPAGVDHFSRLFTSAATTALDAGYSLMLLGREHVTSERLSPLWVDGYVIEDPLADDELLHRVLGRNIPVVTVGWDPRRRSAAPYVATRDGSTLMLDHLRERGASCIALISGRERTSWHVTGEQAYRKWSAAHGNAVVSTRVPESAGVEGGRVAGTALLEAHPAVDAVFCHTARHAAGVIQAANALGRTVPDDVLVAAGSDSELARAGRPPITTIDLRPEDLGREAVRMLVDNLSSSAPTQKIALDARLLSRASTEGLRGR